MKKILFILLLFSLKGYSQNDMVGANISRDTFQVGYPGSKQPLIHFRGFTSGSFFIKAPSTITTWSWTVPNAAPVSNGSSFVINTDGTSTFGIRLADPGGNGYLVRTAAGTTVNRTFQGTANRIVFTNADGQSGNTGVDVGSDIGIIGSTRVNQWDAANGDMSMGNFKITNVATPTLDGDATPKSYVDDLLTGIHYEAAVRYATAAALSANTYANGTAGVGATLTGNANGAVTIDGQTPSVNDRLLIKNETPETDNGIYTVTTVGDGSNPYVLTRATDFDESAEIVEGDAVFVLSGGSTNALTTWVQNTVGTITVGTTAITFVQINAGAALADDEVTNPKLAEMGAHTFKANITGSTANPTDISQTQLTAEINLATTTLKGAVPPPGTATGKVLYDNLAWALPTVTSSNITGPVEDWGDLLTTLGGYQPLDADLTTISGLTATTDNFLIGVSSAWASRTPAQAKVTLGLDQVNNTTDAAKPVSTATQTALDLKLNLAGGTMTGPIVFASTQLGVPTYARVTGSNATTTGQSLVDITGLTQALVANAVYEIEIVLSVSTTAVTTGTGYAVQFSAALATIESHITGALTSTATKTLRINAFNTSAQAWLTTSAQTGGILIKGTVTTGANAGTISARHLKITSGTSTVFIGSYLKVTRIL